MARGSAIRPKLFVISLVLYLVAFVFGVALNYLSPSSADSFYDSLVERFRAEFEGVEGVTRIYFKIFLNNLSIMAVMAFGGVVFAIPPIFILLVNGFPLGIVLARSEKPLMLFVGSILPHGIFEFPATFLSGSFGILLGIDSGSLIWHWMKGEGEAPTRILLADLRRVLKGFIIVAILLAVAAAIESVLYVIYGGVE